MSLRLTAILLFVMRLSSSYAQPAGMFTATGSLITPRWGHTATLLNNGKVLIAGGRPTDTPSTTPSPPPPLASTELYDPSTGSFVAAGAMTEPRAGHTATLLPDGRVLIAGGADLRFAPADGSAEIYDPSSNAFTSTGAMFASLYPNTATLLNSGKVLSTGSLNGEYCGSMVTEPVSELYDPALGTFAPTGSAPTMYCLPTATLLPDGQVLILPGHEGDPPFTEIYNPATGLFSLRGWVNSFQLSSTATLLTTGQSIGHAQPSRRRRQPGSDGALRLGGRGVHCRCHNGFWRMAARWRHALRWESLARRRLVRRTALPSLRSQFRRVHEHRRHGLGPARSHCNTPERWLRSPRGRSAQRLGSSQRRGTVSSPSCFPSSRIVFPLRRWTGARSNPARKHAPSRVDR